MKGEKDIIVIIITISIIVAFHSKEVTNIRIKMSMNKNSYHVSDFPVWIF